MKSALFLSVLFLAATASAQTVPARRSASDYAVFVHHGHFTIAARQASKKQVRAAFIPEVSREFIAFEVAVFPDAGTSVDLARDDFRLLTTKGFMLAPSDSRDVAEFVVSPNGWDRTSSLSPSYVGVESPGERPINDLPRGRSSGLESAPSIAHSEAGVRWAEQKIDQKMLPVDTVSAPVAGYLLFRRHKQPKTSTYELHFKNGPDEVVLVVPPAK